MHMHLAGPPLPRSYLLFLGIWAGEYPGGVDERQTRSRLSGFAREGIDFFVDLTEEGELEPYDGLLPKRARHVRVPLRAGALPDPELVRDAIEYVDRALGDGFFVYVHGAGGLGRTGVVVACWLADRQLHDGDPVAALDRHRSKILGPREPSPETAEERAFVRGWTRGDLRYRPSLEELAERARAAGARVGLGPDDLRPQPG
jgi:hypothetical protein